MRLSTFPNSSGLVGGDTYFKKGDISSSSDVSPCLLGSIIYLFASRRIKRNILKRSQVHAKKLVPIIYW